MGGDDKAGALSYGSRAVWRWEIRLLSILLSLYSGSLKMKSEPDFASGLSSIGVRVRSRRKIGDEVCESMSSSESSLGLSAKIEEIKNAAMGETSPLPKGGGSSPVRPVSELGVEELLGLPVDRREISFLVSEEALDRCSIRGVISAPRGAEALEEYKRALEVTAARKAAIHWVVPAGAVIFSLPEVRQAAPIVAPSSSKKRSRASVFKPSFYASRSFSKALASLNSEVFPMTPTRPSLDEDTSKVVRSLQGDVLQVASQLFHLKGRMKDRSATKAERDALAIRLREEKDAILAKDEEIEAWKIRVQYLDEERERLEAEDVSLQRQLEDKEEEICELRYAAEVFDAEKIKAVNDAKVVVRWELMREWLDDQTDRWDPITSFEQYKVVKISEAEFLGLPPPSFEYKP
ncbi:LOW QUALITY PROTEIN: hypothetical protein HID58_048073 [Brassica napus]|uniref:Uncharacterized protein n=1 Tax=Brassica napus TaxID=3708 RepID=A0ABQ8B119_BRANA|nr:LOW QUALITY PROTEIN: hypothetical protein HID58_048073 [Brassica napus]